MRESKNDMVMIISDHPTKYDKDVLCLLKPINKLTISKLLHNLEIAGFSFLCEFDKIIWALLYVVVIE